MEIDIKINKVLERRNATCLRCGLWRFILSADQPVNLAFFLVSTKIQKYKVKCEELSIHNYSFSLKNTMQELVPLSFCQVDNIVYFMCEDYFPPFLYNNLFYQLGEGHTTGKSYLRDKILFRGGLDYYPSIKEDADNITAGKMKFVSGSVSLPNTNGEFDEFIRYFGNNFQVFMRENEEEITPLYEYYIKNIKLKLNKVTFQLSDKREKLKQKIPSEKFTLEKYKYMGNPGNPDQKSSYLGKPIPDVYGYCVNVKAICLDEFDIFLEDHHTKKDYRTFKCARKITRIDKIMVKMQQPETGAEVWTVQYGERTDDDGNPQFVDRIRTLDGDNGEFTMNIIYCMPPWFGYEVPEVYDVIVTGVFSPQEYPHEIIGELLATYSRLSFDEYNYVMDEYVSELNVLEKIGVVFEKEVDIFEAIEQVQNASTYSFMFRNNFNKFTAKRNDDGRQISMSIKSADIINLEEVEFDMNAKEYATIVDIEYNKDYKEGNIEHLIDDRNKQRVLNIFHVDNNFVAKTLLNTKEAAQTKANILIKFFQEPRPAISGVSLFGKKYFDLNVYDVIEIDFRKELENEYNFSRLVSLFESSQELQITSIGHVDSGEIIRTRTQQRKHYRDFIGNIICKIVGIEKVTKTQTVTLDLLFIGNGYLKTINFMYLNANGREIFHEGDIMQGTTKLVITLDRYIPDFYMSDISIAFGETGATGTVITDLGGGMYEVAIENVARTGEITVTLYKSGYFFVPESRKVVIYDDKPGVVVGFTALTAEFPPEPPPEPEPEPTDPPEGA